MKDMPQAMRTTEKIIKKSCIRKLWANLNTSIQNEVCVCAQQMIEKTCETGPLQKYLLHSLIPSAAMYKVLTEYGISKEEAYNEIKDAVFCTMRPRRRKMKMISSMPWAFNWVWKNMPNFIMKKFPSKGWDIQWIKKDNREIKFNMKSCFYCDFFRIYECPELTPIFCSCDRISYGLMKSFNFTRTHTLATGGTKCNFDFKRTN